MKKTAKPKPTPTPPSSSWLRFAALPWRLGMGLVAGGLAAWLVPDALTPLTRSIAGWDAFSAINMALILVAMRMADTNDIRRVAASDDLPRAVGFVVMIGGALASLAAVVGLLGSLKNLPQETKALHIALGIGAVALSWTLVHCVFTLRYAHTYYDADEQGNDLGGLVFPDDTGKDYKDKLEPNYLDFAYFSFVIGMTAQTADVGISTRDIRRIALQHCLVSFIFNTAIVALTIGTIGGILS